MASGRVALYWYLSTNPPADDDFSDYRHGPPIAQTALLQSTVGPEQGYERVVKGASAGHDSVVISGLTDGREYWFKAVAFDLMGRLILSTDPVMTIPGPTAVPSRTIPVVIGGRFSWSFDGDSIHFAEGRAFQGNTISSLAISSPAVAHTTAEGLLRDAEVSPDGSQVAYTATSTITAGGIDYRIWILDRMTGATKPVTPGRVDADAAWGAPGVLYFCRGTPGPPNIPEIWRLDLGSSELRPVTSDPTIYKYQLSVRPEDQLIVYSGVRNSRYLRYGLYLVSQANGQSTSLASFRWHSDTSPFWTADGRHVTFVSDRSGHAEVWSVDTQTGALKQVTRGGRGRRVQVARWSPDGSRLAVLEGEGWEGHPASLEIYDGISPLP